VYSSFITYLSFLGMAALAYPASHAAAQQATEVVSGRVTTDSGIAISGATVIVTRAPDRLSLTTVTGADGSYRVVFQDGSGDYLVFVSAVGRATFRKRVRRDEPGGLIADARLSSQLAEELQAVRVRANRVKKPTRGSPAFGSGIGSADTPITGFAGSVTPDNQGNIGEIMATVPGALVTPDGVSFLGLPAAQNSTTLNGMSFAGTTMPREARSRVRVGTSIYDPSRGGFSGAETSIEISPGSWLTRNTAHLTLTPPVTAGDPIASGSGNGYSYLGLGAGRSGEIAPLQIVYTTALDVAYQTTPALSFNNAPPAIIRSTGILPDTAVRIRSLLHGLGFPAAAGGAGQKNVDRNGSFIFRFDRTPGAKVSLNGTGYLALSQTQGSGISPLTTNDAALTEKNVVAFADIGRSEYFSDEFGLNETHLGVNITQSHQMPGTQLPTGTVLVSSALEDGNDAGVASQQISFGGSPLNESTSHTLNLQLRNEATRTSRDGAHNVKVTTEVAFAHASSHGAVNQLGTFAFNSLADLEQGFPTSYSRTVGSDFAAVGQWTGYAAVGDLWRASDKLQLLYGVRIEGSMLADAPPFNSALFSQLGIRNDRIPASITLSPRLGFRWVYAKSDGLGGTVMSPLGTFFDQGPLAIVRGGIGQFSAPVSTQMLAPAFGRTGLSGSPQLLQCLGNAVPAPMWSDYLSGSSTPTQCAGGANPELQSFAPTALVFGRSFRGPRSWRANIGATTQRGPWVISLDGVYSLNLNQPSFVDANFLPTVRFRTSDEDRPIFASAAGITPIGGSVSTLESRRSNQFQTVETQGSAARSTTRAVTMSLQPNFSTLGNGFLAFTYTLSDSKLRANGFGAPTFGNPLIWETARGNLDIRHQFLLQAGYRFDNGIALSAVARTSSGMPFTPMVGGDVNGDGFANDRAFIFDPSGINSEIGKSLSEFMSTSSTSIRDCLSRQLGRPAARNSCSGPWTTMLNAEVSAPGRYFRLGRSTRVTLAFANPLAGVDQLLHGVNHLHGWGAPAVPNATLYTVRTYSAASKQFVYDVNSRFGTTNRTTSNTLAPFRVTLNVSVDLSENFDAQQLRHTLRVARHGPAGTPLSADMIRERYARMVPDPYVILQTYTDSLLLSRAQEVELRKQDQRYRTSVDSVWGRLALTIVDLQDHYNVAATLKQITTATDSVWALTKSEQPIVRRILSPLQWRLAPGIVIEILDPASNIRFQPQD
jgi:hypothetical protein